MKHNNLKKPAAVLTALALAAALLAGCGAASDSMAASSAPANLKHCNTLPGWQYTGQMTAGGQCSPLRRNFLLSFLIIFYSIISIFYNAR